MILITHNMLASPIKEAAKQLPLGRAAPGRAPACACVRSFDPWRTAPVQAHTGCGGAWAYGGTGARGRGRRCRGTEQRRRPNTGPRFGAATARRLRGYCVRRPPAPRAC